MKRRLTPDTPYLALTQAYRARGDSELADKTQEIADKARSAHDKAILNGIFAEAEEIVKMGGVVQRIAK